jgi:SPP1 family predicted phage head-tail adaptor
MSAVEIGALNRRLVLEAPVETADGAGGVTRGYESAGTLWASVEPSSIRSAVEAGSLGATITHRIRIRFYPDITVRHRFRDGARIFRIVAMQEKANRRFLDIAAEERRD